VTKLLSDYAGNNAQAEANAIIASPEAQRAYRTGNFGSMLEEFRRREITLQGGFAIALIDDRAEATYQAPDSWYVLKGKLPLQSVAHRSPLPIALDGNEYMLAVSNFGSNGRVLVAMPLPAQYSSTLRELENSERKYAALRLERKLIRQTYLLVLLLLTVIVLFAATWFALYLSKMVIRPVSALEEATQKISSGQLDYRVEVTAGDELAELVASFNRMATELESSRTQIENSSRELEERRRSMETILESIPTGVVSLDSGGNITKLSPSALTTGIQFTPYVETMKVGQSDRKTTFTKLIPRWRRRNGGQDGSLANVFPQLTVSMFRELHDTAAQTTVTKTENTSSNDRARFDFTQTDNFARFKLQFQYFDMEVEDPQIVGQPAGMD